MKWLKMSMVALVLLAGGGLTGPAFGANKAKPVAMPKSQSALGTWMVVMMVPNGSGTGVSPVLIPVPLRFVNQGGGAFAIDMGVIVPGGYGIDLGGTVMFGFAAGGGTPIDPVFLGVNRGSTLAGIYHQSYAPATTSLWFAFRVN